MYNYNYFEAVCNDVREEIAESWAEEYLAHNWDVDVRFYARKMIDGEDFSI